MNLRLSAPKGKNLDDYLFCLPFNLYGRPKKVDGHLLVTKDKTIEVYIDGELKESFGFEDFDEYACEQLTGCSVMVGRKDDVTVKRICAFTNDEFISFAEVCKIINHYLTTGVLVEKSDIDEPKCPKCHLPLDGYTECPYCASKVKVFSKLVRRVMPYKWIFLLSILCTIAGELLNMVTPYVNRILIDEHVIPAQNYEKDFEVNGFILLCISLVVISILKVAIDFVNMKSSYYVALNIGKDLREDLFKKTLDLSMNSVSKKSAGELINRVSNDANTLQSFITDNGKQAIVRIMSLIIVAVIAFVMNWRLALMSILPIPIVMLTVKKLTMTIRMYFGRSRRCANNHSKLLHDTLNGIRVVKSCGTEAQEIKKYEAASGKWAKAITKAEIIWQIFWPMQDFLLTFGNYLVLFFGAKMILNQMPASWGTMTLGELTQFTSYITMLYTPLRWLLNLPRTFANASVSASKVFEILEEQTEIQDSTDCVDLDIT